MSIPAINDVFGMFVFVFDVLVDDEPCKLERCEWALFPHTEPIDKIEDDNYCKKCMRDMIINENQSFCVCISCGAVKPILIFKQNYKDMTFEFTGYAYQRNYTF